jgi:hypothetical protein
VVEVDDASARMRYAGGAPCETPTSVDERIPLASAS